MPQSQGRDAELHRPFPAYGGTPQHEWRTRVGRLRFPRFVESGVTGTTQTRTFCSPSMTLLRFVAGSGVSRGIAFTARSFLEPGVQKRLGGPVGDSDGFVGFKSADVAQDGNGLAAGDKTEGTFEPS